MIFQLCFITKTLKFKITYYFNILLTDEYQYTKFYIWNWAGKTVLPNILVNMLRIRLTESLQLNSVHWVETGRPERPYLRRIAPLGRLRYQIK